MGVLSNRFGVSLSTENGSLHPSEGQIERKLLLLATAAFFSFTIHLSLGWVLFHSMKNVSVQQPRRPLEFRVVTPPPPIPTAPVFQKAIPPPRPQSQPPRVVKPTVSPRPAPSPVPPSEKIEKIVEDKTAVMPDPISAPAQAPEEAAAPRESEMENAPARPVENEIKESGASVVGPLFEADYLSNPSPSTKYPPIAIKLRLQGTALVRVLVNPSGKPEVVQLEKSSGASILDRAAVELVQGWTFVPARRGSDPISAWVDVPIRFRLN